MHYFRKPWVKIAASGGLLLAALFLLLFVYLLYTLPTLSNLESRVVSQGTEIYDRTGKILLFSFGEQPRIFVPLKDIPKAVIEATLAAEDDGFYDHSAISIKGILRSVFLNISQGGLYYGGSTITQQLAKTLFLKPEKTIVRKAREIILAFELERRYSKDEIFELYLNSIPYGSGSYGIATAAKLYFGKELSQLSLEEISTLAALPRSPGSLSPYRPENRAQLEDRSKWVLQRMLDLNFISEKEMAAATNNRVRFLPFSKGILAPHFVMYVRSILEERYGGETLEKEGFRVITTLDYNLQHEAELAVQEGAKRNEELYKGKNAALVSLDAKTGEILAMVGSRDFFDEEIDGQYNVITGKRQPGSSFKVFSYLTLFTKGYGPQTVLFDLPTEFNPQCSGLLTIEDLNKKTPPESAGPKCYHPQNFDKKFKGPLTIREALAQSVNVPSVKVIYLAGVAETARTAQRFGITSNLNPDEFGLSLGLGTALVQPLELAAAYAVFANEGKLPSVSGILEVRDGSGRLLERYVPKFEEVIEPQYTRLINDILSDDIARSPLFGRNSLMNIPGHTSAIKTGTSQNYRDAWAIGYTPSVVTAVWAGNNDETPMETSGGILAAVPIWNRFMTAALRDKTDETFTPPDPVPVSSKTMLNGSYVSTAGGLPTVHSILFYVDKKNPLGPLPPLPDADPQFRNWEIAVQNWWLVNQALLSTPTQNY